ncbi:tetraspanin-11-like [Pollicipes pollicipes]|uniref:tetraspanin-11-like n=1 Tax=Pollicipes pollicipes TaxID=41117 RepID=UPI0018849B08|nr:tetraspanin-11-like [Pollicipes pollicipes]
MLQSGFRCCGVVSGFDWARNNSLTTVVPWSCCRRLPNGTSEACEAAPTNADSYYSVGCLAAARHLLTAEGWLLGGIAIAITVILVVSSVAGCCFARTKRTQIYSKVWSR